MAATITIVRPKQFQFVKKYCATALAIGLTGCIKLTTENAVSSRDVALYKLAAKRSISLSIKSSEN